MDLRLITEKQKNQYNKLVTHVIQSWQWGEARKALGVPLLRFGLYEGNNLKQVFQLTLHKIPLTNQYVGYLPKGPYPDKKLAQALGKIGKEHNCAFIKLEPDVLLPTTNYQLPTTFHLSPKPLFTKYNFVIDLSKSEDDLLKSMHPKTRYNIRVAQKHGVKVEQNLDDASFKIYLKLYFETTKRQGYYGHSEKYHRQIWETLKKSNMARLLIAYLKNQPITAWMLLNFNDTLYYPYGGSSKVHPEVMANNLVAWEAIKLGKKMGLKKFDMWGALGPDANLKDPWFGFHRFKQGYGGKLLEYIGTYDLVFNWPLYLVFTFIDKLMPIKVFLFKMDLTLIISLGAIIGCILALSWFAGSDAPFIPTKTEAIRKILKMAGVSNGKKFYELGSGDGRVVIAAAGLGAKAVGIEQSWIRVLYSRWKAVGKNCKFYHGDIFKRNYKDGDIIYIYLLIKGVKKLESKLRKELKKGVVVITQTYHFPNWKPFKKIDLSKEIDFSKDIKGAGNFWFYVR